MVKIICLVGESSCGKDSILKEVLNRNPQLKPIISTTSRPMRKGETDGIEYNFKTITEVNQMLQNDCFIENRQYKVANGDIWIYGITKKAIDLESNNI